MILFEYLLNQVVGDLLLLLLVARDLMVSLLDHSYEDCHCFVFVMVFGMDFQSLAVILPSYVAAVSSVAVGGFLNSYCLVHPV